jgi:hypothetical protein
MSLEMKLLMNDAWFDATYPSYFKRRANAKLGPK